MCFAAVLAFSAVMVTSASATEILLSSATGTFKAAGGTAELIGASKVVCETTTTNGTQTDAHLGNFVIEFNKCKVGGIECTGTTDTVKGRITTEGVYHIGLGMKSGTSGESNPGILVLPENPSKPKVKGIVEFTCGILGTVKVRGNIVGLFLRKAGGAAQPGDALTGLIICFKVVVGKPTEQEDRAFLLSLTTPENELMPKTGEPPIQLESSVFGGAFKESGEEASGEITETTPSNSSLVTG